MNAWIRTITNHTLASIVFSLMLALGLMLGIWVADRRFPMEILANRVITADVARGQPVTIEYNIIRHFSCPVKVERFVIDSNRVRHVMPDFDLSRTGPNGVVTMRSQFVVPDDAALGEAEYGVVFTYSCNPIQKNGWPVIIVVPPLKFNVLRAEPRQGKLDSNKRMLYSEVMVVYASDEH